MVQFHNEAGLTLIGWTIVVALISGYFVGSEMSTIVIPLTLIIGDLLVRWKENEPAGFEDFIDPSQGCYLFFFVHGWLIGVINSVWAIPYIIEGPNPLYIVAGIVSGLIGYYLVTVEVD